jgi:hypothetical protein
MHLGFVGIGYSTANYVGTRDLVIKEESMGKHIMHFLVKGTLRRHRWCAFCVWRGAGGGARAAIMVHPKEESLPRLEQNYIQGEKKNTLCIYK